jgi:hypothetical protein
MSRISPQLSTHSIGGAPPHGDNTRPSHRAADELSAGNRRRPPAAPSIVPPPAPGNDAFTIFTGQTCLEARVNHLVEPSVDRKLLQPAAFCAALRRAHDTLRDAASRDPQLHPALQVLDRIVELNRTANDFRHALHLV